MSIVCFYKKQGNQYHYRGHVINFPQDVSHIAKELPHSFETISKYIIIRRSDNLNGFYDFFVNKNRIIIELLVSLLNYYY